MNHGSTKDIQAQEELDEALASAMQSAESAPTNPDYQQPQYHFDDAATEMAPPIITRLEKIIAYSNQYLYGNRLSPVRVF